MLRRTAIALAFTASALALGACTSSCAHRDGCAYQRNDPTAAQSAGVHGASIARRLPILRREAGARVEGLLVNRWGELWTELDGGRHIAIAHDGTDVDPYAIDRAMRRIAEADPGRPFVKGTLTRNDFLWGGLRWEIMVGGGKYYATYTAAPDGSSICRLVVSDHGSATPVHKCPDFGHQPPGIPAE